MKVSDERSATKSRNSFQSFIEGRKRGLRKEKGRSQEERGSQVTTAAPGEPLVPPAPLTSKEYIHSTSFFIHLLMGT